MHICVIGTGYVGLITGVCFAEFGLRVTCVDSDAKKIKLMEKAFVPFFEPGLEEMLRRNLKAGRIRFTTNVADAVDSSLVIFIAVGTPPRGDGSADMRHVEDVAREIAKHINGYKVIVTKSTVPVGTGDRLKKIISKNLKETVDFDIASNPEFLREGAGIEDFMRPNRVVIGASSSRAIAIMKDLYKPLYLIETPFVITDVKTAELIKYASNAFLATKISFINEIANLCETIGADVQLVAKAMGLDQRIGPKFLHAGPGFGGSCFPKDVRALTKIGEDMGVNMGLLKEADRINMERIRVFVEKIRKALWILKDKKIALLGLSFKPETDDIREAPSIRVIQELLKEGSLLRLYDPKAMENMKLVFPEDPPQIIYSRSSYEAAEGANALLVITEWEEFCNLDLKKVKSLMDNPIIVDGRNIFEPEAVRKLGFEYYSIGRK